MDTTLEQVGLAFDHWRATRAKRRPIPDELIAQTLALPNKYNKTDITRRLAINHGTLQRWLKQDSTQESFLTVGALTVEPNPLLNSKSFEASIRFSSGSQLMLSGSESQVATFVIALQQRGEL